MKNVTFYLLIATIAGGLTLGSCKKKGCTDEAATNYNKDAEKDDGTCKYPSGADSGTSGETGNSGGNETSPCIEMNAECLNAEKIADNIGLDGRLGTAGVVFNGKMWVIGGNYFIGSTYYSCNDVWSSTDGITWQQVVSEAPFSKRAYHSLTVHDNKMWVIGGRLSGNSTVNDVWYSEDGINWIEATANAQFSERDFHQVASFQNELYLVGGRGFDDEEIWKSSDGITWTLVTDTPEMGGRSFHGLDVYDGKMWLFAGRSDLDSKRDVWYSSNGQNWTEVSTQTYFTSRTAQNAFSYNQKMYVIGGVRNSDVRNDLWVSADNGVNWTQYAASNEDFLNRTGSIAIPFNNYIYVLGGEHGDDYPADVWRIEAI